MKSSSLTLFYLILALSAAIAGCNSNSAPPPPPPPPPNVTVTVSAATSTQVEAGGTLSLTASAVGDPASKGVTWSLLPATGAGSLSNTTSSLATYNAPASAPPSDLVVTVIATSISNPAKANNLILDVPPIFVSLATSVNPVGAAGTSQITAMVTNDPANKGVDPASWTISPATGAGTLSGQTSTSVTYTAPANAPSSDQQVTITATSASAAPQTGSTIITFAAIAVSLSPNPITVQACPSPGCATGTSQITATVSFDPANKGVDPASWTIAPATRAGTLSGQTGTSVTYTAPSTPPAANLPVMITAKSLSDSSRSGSVTVTVLAISVFVSPGSAIIPVTAAQTFTSTINNDPANVGVNWTVAQGSPPGPCSPASACGTFSSGSTLSGASTTYTAPAAVPTPATVAVTATSVTDATKSAIATVTLTNGTVKVVPSSLNFGSVKTTSSRSLTIIVTNTGASALTMNTPTFTGTNPTEFSVTANTCGTSVAAGAPCSLTITFKPVSAVAYSAVLNINDSSTDSPQLVTLAGHGAIRFRVLPSPESSLAANRAPAAPLPTGSNAVGTQVMDLVDPKRSDPFLSNGAHRELLVRFWYPASAGQACARADYASPQVWSDFSRLLGISLPHVTTNSCWNASMADGVHPVALFTHGYTGTFTDYTFLFEDLASRGYVVASVDHTFEATAVEFPDGRLARSVLGSHLGNSMRADADAMDFAVSVRLKDLQFVLNSLASINSSTVGPFAGKLDMSRVALAGHSLGGLTTILGVEQDSRFRAGVVLDGVVPNSALHGTETPMLLLAAGRDTWSPEETRLWSGLHGPRIAVNLQGAEHLTPTDAVWLAAGAINTGTMGPDKTIAAIRNYVAAFLDAYLLDKPLDPLLTGPSSEFPDAAVTTRKELLRAKY